MSFTQDFQHRAILPSSAKVVPKVRTVFRTPTIIKRTPAFTSTDNSGINDLSLFTGQGPRNIVGNPLAWSLLNIGGGGFVTGLDIHSDGTLVARVDVYGAYIGNTTPGIPWTQLITSGSMPAGFFNTVAFYPASGGCGCNEIRIAPSNSRTLYMIYTPAESTALAQVFVSRNKGSTWTQCGNIGNIVGNSNDNTFEYAGQKLAIDPNNDACCYVGTSNNGIWFTTDYGVTFTQINSSNIPNPTAGSGYFGMAFDPTSGTTGGLTNRIIVPSYGNGVYISSNAGSTWSAVSGGATNVWHGKVGVDGTYFANGSASGGAGGNIYRLTTAGVWSTINSTNSFNTLACDPANKDHLIIDRRGGNFSECTNATGATPTFTSVNFSHFLNATDVPWLQNSQDNFLTDGDLWFDPTVSGRLWYSFGTGVLYTNAITTAGTQQYFSQTAGIESLVATWITWPPNGPPILSAWDRSIWCIQNPNLPQVNYGPNYSAAIRQGGAACYAISKPTFIIALSSASGNGVAQIYTSSDGGISPTWTASPVQPFTSGNPGGGLAALTTTNWVFAANNNGKVYVTQDGGSSWTNPATLPATGWGSSYFNGARHIVTPDYIDAGTYYIYNTVTPGVYKSTDSGITWSLVHSGALAVSGGDNFNATMKAVPNIGFVNTSGHLFYTNGAQGGQSSTHPTTGANGEFYRSTDHGSNWSNVSSSVLEVWCFGFSAAKPGGSGYPSIGIVGWVNNVYGIWQSDDNGVTWFSLGTFPLNWLDGPVTMEGDPVNYGRWIVGFQGSSFKYYGPGTI